MSHFKQFSNTAVILLAFLSVSASVAYAQLNGLERSRPELDGVGVDENLGDNVPLHLQFMDENGTGVQLQKYFKESRPVILSMNYSSCPLLCSVQLDGLTQTMRKVPWIAGDQFVFVSVSFDPWEKSEQSAATKQKYLADYQKATSDEAWNFLIGNKNGVQKFAQELGIKYKYIENTKQYSHPAVLVICTPEGRISSYLHGIDFSAEKLQSHLELAAAGKITVASPKGSIWPMFCAVYDPNAGVYVLSAVRIMQVSGVLVAISLGSLWWACHRMVLAKSEHNEENEMARRESR